MFGTTDPLDDHLELVRIVSGADVAAPAEWRALHGRLGDFLALDSLDQHPLRDQLAAAIVGGTDAAIPVMRTLALAEVANQAQVQMITTGVRNAVHRRMLEVYDGAAAYAQIAEKFNSAAKRFVDAANTADVEADAASMVEQPDKIRRSWHDAEGFGNELSRLVDPLAAAAALAGVDGADSDAVRIPLCANVDGHHCRKLWTAWLSRDGRCNRWSALHQLGVEVRAADLDGGIESYREPKAMEVRVEPILNADGRVVGSRRVPFDPEDGDVPQPIDPRRRQGRVTTV